MIHSPAMPDMHFTPALKRKISPEAWPWVLTALWQDPLVWNSLENSELGLRALNALDGSPESWSPARLALLDLQLPLPSEGSSPAEWTTPTGTLRLAHHTAKDWQVEELGAGLRLGQIGLLALALRDLAAREGWKALWSHPEAQAWIQTWPGSPVAPGGSLLACLFGMVTDPGAMLEALAASEARHSASRRNRAVALGLHALLSNPLPPEQQQAAALRLLQALPGGLRLAGLRFLGAQRPALARLLGQELKPQPSNLEAGESLKRLSGLVQAAEIKELGGQPAEAISLLDQALEASRQLQAEVAAQMGRAAGLAGSEQRALQAWKQASDLRPDSPCYAAEFGLALLQSGDVEGAGTYLSAWHEAMPHPINPRLRLVEALAAHQAGDREKAVRLGRRALDKGARYLYENEEVEEAGTPGLWQRLADMFAELNLPQEAGLAAELELNACRLSTPALQTLVKARLSLGEARLAITPAHLLEANTPQGEAKALDQAQSLVITALEQAEEWEPALQERENRHRRQPDGWPASGQEWRELANCALRAGKVDQAIPAAKEALKLNSEDAEAHALLGEMYQALGDLVSAEEHLGHATRLAPHEARHWLTLAALFQHCDQPQKAVELLREATQAAPQAAEIHLALGEALLAEKAPSLALPSLRKAASLAARENRTPGLSGGPAAKNMAALARRIALSLGRTLHQLGHFEEGRQVLEQAFEQDDQPDPELAHAYAKTLLALGEVHKALIPLECVIQSQPNDPAPYLAYGQALLQAPSGTAEQSRQAVAALRQAANLAVAKQFSPQHGAAAEAQALLAEALARSGELVEAQAAYRQALNTQLRDEPAWQARLAGGLGRVSLQLGQIETAIAALREAALANPHNVDVQRCLAEAYHAQGLTDEAIQTARNALRLDPGGVDTLVWFAGQMEILAKGHPEAVALHQEAAQAWRQAAQASPERGDLHVRLAEAHWQQGEVEKAREVLNQVLAGLDGSPATATPRMKFAWSDLHAAAYLMQATGDKARSVVLLKRAILLAGGERQAKGGAAPTETSDDEQRRRLSLLSELALAQQQTGQLSDALETIEQALRLSPLALDLVLHKVSLLVEMGEDDQALAFLNQQLESADPAPGSAADGDPGESGPPPAILHYQAALILRRKGELTAALSHAEQATAAEAANLECRYLAADLAACLLQPELARQLLGGGADYPTGAETEAGFALACLTAELSLEANSVQEAAHATALALEARPQHPRAQALQARLMCREGDYSLAGELLHTAQQLIQKEDQPPDPATLRALGEAALELERWDLALPALHQSAVLCSQEPLPQLLLAKALVLQAEAQRLCQALDVVRHAPGEAALSGETYEAFQDAILVAQRWSGQAGTEGSQELWSFRKTEVARWKARGEAVFEPGPASARGLAAACNGAEDIAALIATLRLTGEWRMATKASQAHRSHPAVVLQMALAAAEVNPAQALNTARLVAAEATTPGLKPGSRAMAHFLVARLAHLAGERQAARDAIQAALDIYPDEPRWHALAGEILWGEPQAEGAHRVLPGESAQFEDLLAATQQALRHFDQALELEPNNPDHYLTYGQALAQVGDFAAALPILENGANLDPERADLWLALARAQQAAGQSELAALSAERAIEVAEDPTEAMLLGGRLALMAGDPRSAQNRAQAVLRLSLEHPQALQLLAEAYEGLDRPDEALRTIEKAIPKVARPLPLQIKRAQLIQAVRGKAGDKAGGFAESLRLLQELNERYPGRPSVLAPLAEALIEAGQTNEAIQVARQALQAGGEELEARERARIHFLLGRQMRRNGQLDQAIQHLSDTIRDAADWVEPYLELGQALQSRRQHQQALEVFQKAIQVAPDDPRPYYQASTVLKAGKDYLGAETLLRRAASLAPDDVSIHRLLGAVVALNLVHNRRPSTPGSHDDAQRGAGDGPDDDAFNAKFFEREW